MMKIDGRARVTTDEKNDNATCSLQAILNKKHEVLQEY